MPPDQDKSSKTEAASQYKLKRAREEGQVAKSQDLSGTASFITAIVFLSIYSPYMILQIKELFIYIIANFPINEASQNGIMTILLIVTKTLVILVAPILAVVWVVSFITAAAQVGIKFSVKPLEPKLEKINPIEGMKRLFSKRSLVTTTLSSIKMILVSFIAGSVILNNFGTFITMTQQDLSSIMVLTGKLAWEISTKSIGTLLILAFVDYAYQKWQFLEDQKMSKQEVKEEYKQQEGDPTVKGQIKARQKAAAQKRGLKESVQSADVVVTNPFHIAVAIKYEKDNPEAAPIVVAKGARLLAEKIKSIAREVNVDIIQNIPLARALYKECHVDREIPPELYIAVAEVLAVIYAKRNRN